LISNQGVATLTQLDGILLNTKYNIKHLKKYVERDANEIEVTKVSNEYTCIHPVDIKWQHDVLSKCKVSHQVVLGLQRPYLKCRGLRMDLSTISPF
jgi:hypothetical protein